MKADEANTHETVMAKLISGGLSTGQTGPGSGPADQRENERSMNKHQLCITDKSLGAAINLVAAGHLLT